MTRRVQQDGEGRDGDSIYTAGAYTTCYASSFNGFGPPTTYCLP